MSDLLQAETRSPQAERASGDEIAATVSAAMATMNPALAAAQEGADNFAPLSREIDAEINAVGHANHETSNNSGKTAEVSEQGLPAPPPARSTSLWSRPGFWFGTGGSIAVMVLTILVDSSANEWLLRFAVEAFETGAAFLWRPACCSGMAFISPDETPDRKHPDQPRALRCHGNGRSQGTGDSSVRSAFPHVAHPLCLLPPDQISA